MLKIIGSRKLQSYNLVFDAYVPLTFQNLDIDISLTLYYNLGEENTQLLELGIDMKTGVIVHIALVLPGNKISFEDQPLQVGHYIPEIPVVQTSMWPALDEIQKTWPKHIIQSSIPFIIVMGGDWISVQWDRIGSNLIGYRAGAIDFIANQDGRLCAIEIKNISPEHMKEATDGICHCQ